MVVEADHHAALPSGVEASDGCIEACLGPAEHLFIEVSVVAGDPPLAAVVSLGAESGTIGPVSVTATTEARPLGAWVVRAGGPPAVIGVSEPMEIRLAWRTPDGKEHTRTVVPEEEPVRVRLGKP